MDKSNNKELILRHEREFAAKLASKVIEKPKLSMWMILIPFIFIFYFQDLSNYKKQRTEFIDNYLLSRRKALNEAEEALRKKRYLRTLEIAEQAGMKENETEKYNTLLNVLAVHYSSLLTSSGDSYTSLIKSAYGQKKTNYLLFMNQLGTVEKKLNKALKVKLKKAQDGIVDTIKRIETHSEQLRRIEIEEIYG